MTDRTISLAAAIDALDIGAELLRRVLDEVDVVGTEREKYEWGLGLIESYISDMKELPSVQPEQQWIPCSERCPEYFVPVLTWDGQNQCVEMRIPYVITTEGEIIKGDWWCGDYWEDKEESLYHPYDLRDGAALAWMPLPEPWKGERYE